MNFKKYPQGNLDFINVRTRYVQENNRAPRFLFENDYYSSEKFAIRYFKSKGFNAFFSENTLWIELLILLFSDELKGNENHKPDLIYHPYRYDENYFNENKDRFIERFNYLKETDLIQEIKKPSRKIVNLCNHFENEQILQVLYNLIENFIYNKKGFPDIFVYDDKNAFFCEVKGNADSLSYVQIKKHEVLLNAGIDVKIFSINKNIRWQEKTRKRYFNKGLFRRTNFIDNYDSKIYVAQKVYDELREYGIDEFKDDFLKTNDADVFISFLNLIEDYSLKEKIYIIKSDNSEITKKAIEQSEILKDKRILKNAKILEDKHKYKEAINLYSKVNSFKSYKRIIYCYRKLNDYEMELDLIYAGINNPDFDKHEKGFFKRRLKRFFKNKKDYSVTETCDKCPMCESQVVLNKFNTRNGIEFFTCSNEKCYWYGGFYKTND